MMDIKLTSDQMKAAGFIEGDATSYDHVQVSHVYAGSAFLFNLACTTPIGRMTGHEHTVCRAMRRLLSV